ncbi:hypothetical protein [Streptomyces sp. NPDC059389]|uniref:hypothetical protein n=1 Tax=Streptomyces sp. NPDC059389 TaxID=3346818 RepID=UPI003689D6BF
MGPANHKLLHGTDQQLAYYSASSWGPSSGPARRLPAPGTHLQPRYTLADTAPALPGLPKGLPRGPDPAGPEVS